MVVVVLAPVGAKMSRREVPGRNIEFGCLEMNGLTLGLQVLKPAVQSYPETEMIFDQVRGQMARPSHIGLMSETPQWMLSHPDFIPLVFQADNMCGAYLNVRRAGTMMLASKEHN